VTPVSIPDLYRLTGRVAVVTGGAQNLGLEIATGLSEAGATLAITSRNLDKATQVASRLTSELGATVMAVALEITSEASVKAAFAQIHERFGQIDIVVNNAGGHTAGSSGDVVGESFAAWSGFINANLNGTFLCVREAARYMVPRKQGSIINIASISSDIGRDRAIYDGCEGMKNPIGYTASKAGVLGLTYDAAALLGPDGIRVNAISPGGFERGQPAVFVQRYADRTMLGRMGQTGFDLKGPVVFLASEASRYVTGHNLVVDGGFTKLK
jgi:NAD(P)-dependent dehydrogenase (short-subunit alcohol dehydrogenase family)